MQVLNNAPATLEDTAIYRRLLEISKPRDGLAEKVHQFVKAASPLLDLIIAGPFSQYTLHNPGHSRKIVHLAGELMGDKVLRNLTVLECAIIIYSAYLHDLGMCLTTVERDRLIASVELQESIREWPELWRRLDAARKRVIEETPLGRPTAEREVHELTQIGLAAYLRPRHATRERYTHILTMIVSEVGRRDLFELAGTSFEESLIDICCSHCFDIASLAEITGPYECRFPRDLAFAGELLNTQFCAAMLRLGDLLDFDRERTPSVLFANLGLSAVALPGSEVSLREWQKHMAVHTLKLDANQLVIEGECKHPAIECAIRSFCLVMERELRDASAILRKNEPAILERYSFDLPMTVRPQIKSVGYIYRDVSLRLNQSAVMELLMGERLYSHYAAAARELVQNAIDACMARQRMRPSGYVPRISVSTEEDSDQKTWLVVQDNGIGMDEHVICEYFLQVGTSYYSSSEFETLLRKNGEESFKPIARFGIGIVSVFMIGDILDVRTCNPDSPRADTKARRILIDDRGGVAYIAEIPHNFGGTVVRVRLKEGFASDEHIDGIRQYLQATVVRPRFPIEWHLNTQSGTLSDERPYFSIRDLRTVRGVSKHVEVVLVHMDRFSNILKGVVALVLAREGEMLSHVFNNEVMVFGLGRGRVNPRRVFENYEHNQITVDGFAMNFRRLGKMFRRGPMRRLSLAFDLDIVGGGVEYDVSRERIIGLGREVVKKDLRESLLRGLKEMGVYDRLLPATKALLTPPIRSFVPIADESTLLAVQQVIGDGKITSGIHRQVMRELNVTAEIAGRAIQTLRIQGRVGV